MKLHYQTATESVVCLGETLALAHTFHRYVELHRDEPFACLLDSASEMAGLGRYSFLGASPRAVLRVKRAADGGGTDGFVELERRLTALAMPSDVRAQIDLPFVGGYVGYVGYDAGRYLERLPDRTRDDLALPDLYLIQIDQLLAHDHATATTQMFTTGRGASRQEAERDAEARHTDYRSRVLSFQPERADADEPRAFELDEAMSARDYEALVEAAREHIAAGDIFQVCTSHRMSAAISGDGWSLYRQLRARNPAPFASYLQFPELRVLSSSPERFLRLDRTGRAESRPIKGTRPRGATPREDDALRAELSSSEKDRAENLMIVDLVRNDFGRVCALDSIRVPALMQIEAHPTVFQMVSTVSGRLASDRSALALFRACFPPGSMTGAPKIEAMKIIESLERDKRGIYAGAIGYFDVGGGFDFSVVIRTFVVANGRAYFNVGGAVLADSDPAAEYRETMDKARALLDALSAHANV
ncbi:MAG TPA: aminodeoxychorismate synthase component I [Polyangiales bacterium]|nr:aminodeoxychorismate synthase component I [Polyangiales bacterium]